MDLFAWHVIGSLLQSTKISINIQAPPMSSSISFPSPSPTKLYSETTNQTNAKKQLLSASGVYDNLVIIHLH